MLREPKVRISGPHGAALRLGLKRSTLLDRMKKLGIDAREIRGRVLPRVKSLSSNEFASK